jgi:small subunit ribosomal protein S8
MSLHDPIADMLTKIRNAANAKHEKVDIPLSKLKVEVVKILKNEGFIKNFKLIEEEGKPVIRIFLKYADSGQAVIQGLTRVSSPGRRIYQGYEDVPRIYNGLAVTIVSTSKGVITGKKARQQKVGGEVLCYVW